MSAHRIDIDPRDFAQPLERFDHARRKLYQLMERWDHPLASESAVIREGVLEIHLIQGGLDDIDRD